MEEILVINLFSILSLFNDGRGSRTRSNASTTKRRFRPTTRTMTKKIKED